MATKEEDGFFEDWPKWAKPTMALAAMILLGGAWIGAPFLITFHLMKQNAAQGIVTFQPLTTVLVAMTTATIAGVFLFMTLRIDRGTRLKATSVAKNAVKGEVERLENEARELLEDVEEEAMALLKSINTSADLQMAKVRGEVQDVRIEVEETVGTFMKEKFDEGTTPRKIREEIERSLTEEALRRHVEAVLLVDANVKMIEEYARERAGDLDEETIERIVKLMEELVKAWRGQTEEKTPRRGIMAALKAVFGKLRRSPKDG